MPPILENQSFDQDVLPLSVDSLTDGPKLRVRGADGELRALSREAVTRLLAERAEDLPGLDLDQVATRVIDGLYDGVSEEEYDKLLVQVPAALTAEDPNYSFLAARLLLRVMRKEVGTHGIRSFSDSVRVGFEEGIIAPATARFVADNAAVLDATIEGERSGLFQYFGLRTVYDRYVLRHPINRRIIETPQHFFLRVACGLARSVDEAVEFYRVISSLEYMPSSPTLFNSGTRHSQMSSCYLLDSPPDELEGIYGRYTDIARLSKFAGGIGVAWHRVRARGSLIRGTNGQSNGIVPWLKTLDSSVAAVNQGGRRKGACCVYLETWHADMEEFLELRDNTGDEARRAHNLNLANWVPDLFMKRVQADEMWSLFDPKEVPHFVDLYGDDFERAYVQAEADGLAMRQLKARDLYARMMRTLAQTGNGWMTFKDACNRKSNQTGHPGRVVHSSNLCTEIVEVTNQGETAVCNLGSVNLARFVVDGAVDFEKLRARVKVAVKYLDRVIDINYYPTAEAKASNDLWRPVGLGLMGLQDVLFLLRMPFDSDEARLLSTAIQEEIYFAALEASCELAELYGPHQTFSETRAARGNLQFDLWGVKPGSDHQGQLGLFGGGEDASRWDKLKARIAEHGLRNSLLIAIAPTATIASICGCFECIEPQVSNLFKRETLSGEFLQINRYLVDDLKSLGLWVPEVREAIKNGEGSVQVIHEIPAELRHLYRTAWELPQRALVDMAASRSPFIDQSASLNLFLAEPTIGKLSSMYAYAWKKGLKTTYYLRSRPRTSIAKATTRAVSDTAAVSCSLENPEYCEACQ
ncbi:MAG: ribonucleoside-diphosphate reductase subunit alpha [Alphaproteobacteria bacterium]|nr:ribonucleoside-diphosphate reductase subunit alpha [Alphaproteobacteria bacterium]MCB9796010.1 ribonucleoside-diphosphate reductase subunit alpha [Alphaproteobacteria bacterium]